MKNILSILVINLTLKVSLLTAQQTIPNNGFENLNTDGTLTNWGNVYLVPISFDSLGNSFYDTLLYDNYFYAPTNDAHNGSTALELRNAWNVTTNTGIAGSAGVDEDAVFSAWGSINLIPVINTPWNVFRPFNLGFYNKFYPVNNDSAFAQIIMYDYSGNQIGEGSVIISAATINYIYTEIPIAYATSDTVGYYSLNFSTFYTASPGSHQPSFGTRLLIDDITFNNAGTSGIGEINNGTALKIFPNPANTVLNIASDADVQYYIFNSTGEIVAKGSISSPSQSISIANLSEGLYNIQLVTKDGSETHTLVKTGF